MGVRPHYLPQRLTSSDNIAYRSAPHFHSNAQRQKATSRSLLRVQFRNVQLAGWRRHAWHRAWSSRLPLRHNTRQLHCPSRFKIIRLRQHSFVFLPVTPTLRARRPPKPACVCGDESFNCMSDRVEPGNRGDASWLRNSKSRIEQCNAKRSFRIAASHLDVGLRVGDQRVTLCFTPGARA